MKKSYFTIFFVLILMAILGGICLSYFSSDTPVGEKNTIEFYVDSSINLSVFTNEITTYSYFEGYDNDTLTWLESLNPNYVVFSANGTYYIMSPYDASKVLVEFATDVSISDVCRCNIVDKKPLGDNLKEVYLVDNVEFVEQHVQYYDV